MSCIFWDCGTNQPEGAPARALLPSERMVESILKKIFTPVVDYYRDLRWSNLRSRKYSHLLLALYWPVYGLVFLSLERLLPLLFDIQYHEISCALDAYIPFNELFVIPYYYWFVFLAGFGVFWLLYEPDVFRQWMWAIILTYSSTVVIYLVYPNMQALRPAEFPRDNILTDIVRGLYNFDTNTNVCPSIHVLGSLAVCFAGLHSRLLRGWGWKVFFVVSTVLISLSTVFLKQHSIIDVYAALAVGAVCYALQYWVAPRICARRAERQQI